MARLEPELRSVLELRVASLTYQEIADALEIPTSTVGTRLLRARQKLRELLAFPLPVPA